MENSCWKQCMPKLFQAKATNLPSGWAGGRSAGRPVGGGGKPKDAPATGGGGACVAVGTNGGVLLAGGGEAGTLDDISATVVAVGARGVLPVGGKVGAGRVGIATPAVDEQAEASTTTEHKTRYRTGFWLILPPGWLSSSCVS
jgi:hypothetical protein